MIRIYLTWFLCHMLWVNYLKTCIRYSKIYFSLNGLLVASVMEHNKMMLSGLLKENGSITTLFLNLILYVFLVDQLDCVYAFKWVFWEQLLTFIFNKWPRLSKIANIALWYLWHYFTKYIKANKDRLLYIF